LALWFESRYDIYAGQDMILSIGVDESLAMQFLKLLATLAVIRTGILSLFGSGTI
jgi:hypothetical protein